MVNACTIVARNYLPYARVLAQSFLSQNPGGDFRVLLIDDEHRTVSDRSAALTCHRLSEIGLSQKEIAQLASIYDVTELATAVKPRFLSYLLSEGRDHVLYLDPDIKVYDSLDTAADLARRHGIVLTPHMTGPLPRDGKRIDDVHILSSGMYNLGFIGLGADTERFIDWWWSRTRRDALIEPLHQMFTDQRWIDYVPSLFEHHILRNPGYNVAYWNLHERDLAWAGDRYTVSEQPLRFFHFSGFNPDAPHLLSKHQGDRPRILLSERAALRRICAEYRADLVHAGLRDAGPPYAWATLASGLPYDRRMRRLYRAGLAAFESGKAPEPPAPFECEASFIAWLNEPVAAGPHPRVSRYLYSVYQDRPDLQAAFPDLAGVDCSRYCLWLPKDGVTQEHIPSVLLPPLDAPAVVATGRFAPASDLRDGVNLAGYFRAELGIGEAARLLRAALEHGGIPHSTLDYDITDSRQEHPYAAGGDERAPHGVNVVCVNADRAPDFAQAVGPQFFQGRHTVGYWFWELERFPATMHSGFDVVDEVWAATRFVTSAIGRIGRRPVYHVPLGVQPPVHAADVTRESLGLPNGFLFLFMFDFFSTAERKNPVGVARAFKQAFRPCEGPTLLLKSINGGNRLTDLEHLRAETTDRPDILVVDDYYTAGRKNSLLALCDCYVSLHRSEGFGLTIAEAMALAKPVIATAYSGNMDFTTPENSYLVEYVTGGVPAHSNPYTPDSPWAEPKIDHAADLMRRVFEARQEAEAKGSRARQDILTKHSLEVSAAAIMRRLDAIRQSRPTIAIDLGETGRRTNGPGIGTTAVTRLSRLVAPTTAEPPASLRGRIRQASRRALFGILGPYWRQRQRHALLLDTLREARATAEKAAAAEPHQQRALAAIWTAVQALETTQLRHQVDIDTLHLVGGNERLDSTEHRVVANRRIVKLGHRLASIRKAVESWRQDAVAHRQRLEADLAGIRLDTSNSVRDMAAIRHAVDGLEAHLASIRRADGETGRRLEALEEQVRAVAEASTTLANRLYAAPYMDDPARFSSTNEAGRSGLSYDARSTLPGDGYRSFEDVFRGSERLIRDRQRVYIPLLLSCGPVVDVGCGRGEMLDLLREAGVPATGVEVNTAMVTHCRTKGHAVEHTDALAYLADRPDASIGAIFAAQVVEHLSHEDFLTFLRLSRAKLRSDGRLIMETVNPHSIEAFKTFWTDLTHVKPIFPEVALTWCWLSGFEKAEVLFPNGSGCHEEDRRTQGEYAVMATRCG